MKGKFTILVARGRPPKQSNAGIISGIRRFASAKNLYRLICSQNEYGIVRDSSIDDEGKLQKCIVEMTEDSVSEQIKLLLY
jgi:hypothetical protein